MMYDDQDLTNVCFPIKKKVQTRSFAYQDGGQARVLVVATLLVDALDFVQPHQLALPARPPIDQSKKTSHHSHSTLSLSLSLEHTVTTDGGHNDQLAA